MKQVAIPLLVIASLIRVAWSEEVLPADVRRVIEQRDAAIAKIDKIYLQELEKVKLRYTKEGKLDVALNIDRMIKNLQPSVESTDSFLEGDWVLHVPSINYTEVRNFKGKYMYTANGVRFRWFKTNNGIKIEAGSGNFEIVTIDSFQPNVMNGEHSNNPNSKFSYTRKTKD